MKKPSILDNPFPGLRPFELGEEHLFFGREGQSDELLKRLYRTRFLGIIGTSGSGKSSLLRAGLLPSLYSGLLPEAGSRWRIAILRPGSAPIHNLASALNMPGVFGVESGIDSDNIRLPLMESTLRRGFLGLVEAAQQGRMGAHENLLVVIDQFEELFRFNQSTQSLDSKDEAIAFVKLILEGVKQRDVPIFVVLTMRSDFLGDCAQFLGLPEALNDSQYLVPRLNRGQLRKVIEGPVAVRGAEIEPKLVNRLLNEIGDSSDQLPILQHALMRTWGCWESKDTPQSPLDISHYEEIGSMNTALSLHADQIYFSLPNQEYRQIAESIFKRLTEAGQDNREVRRPTTLQELYETTLADKEKVVHVVDRFREKEISFLMPSPEIELEDKTIVDLSQESLMRIWDRLQIWISEEFEDAQVYRRLVDTSRLFYSSKASLLRDPELQIAIQWQNKLGGNPGWSIPYSNDFEQVFSFIEESKKRKKEEENSRDKKNETKLRISLSLAAAGVALAGILFSNLYDYITSVNLPTIDNLPSSKLIDFISIFSSNSVKFIGIATLLSATGYLFSSVRIVKKGNAAIVERLGRYRSILSPGLNFIVPFLDSIVFVAPVDEQKLDFVVRQVNSSDNVTFDVLAEIYWHIYDVERAYYAIDHDIELSMKERLATVLRSELGKMYFHQVSSSYEILNKALFDVLDKVTDSWGVKLNRIDICKLPTSSKYIVRPRDQTVILNFMASVIPFSVLLILFSIGLTAAVALASPSVALWIGVSELTVTLIRALFVTVVLSIAFAFILELSR